MLPAPRGPGGRAPEANGRRADCSAYRGVKPPILAANASASRLRGRGGSIVQPMVSRAQRPRTAPRLMSDQGPQPEPSESFMAVYGMASILGATLVALLADLRKKCLTA
jgi:hypothetical protein